MKAIRARQAEQARTYGLAVVTFPTPHGGQLEAVASSARCHTQQNVPDEQTPTHYSADWIEADIQAKNFTVAQMALASMRFYERAHEFLNDFTPPSSVDIIKAVCRGTCITYADFCSARRDSPSVRARHIAAYLMRRFTTLSYPAMGLRMGARDHTTILHAVKCSTLRMEQEGVSPTEDWEETLVLMIAMDWRHNMPRFVQ